MLHVQAQPTSKLKDPATFKVIGQSVPRVDIPAKVTGGVAYVQDLRLPGMLHARVVRPPSYGAQLTDCDTCRGRANARRREGGSRRQFPRRRRREGIPGGQGDAGASRPPRNGRRLPSCRSRMIFLPRCWRFQNKASRSSPRSDASASGTKTIEATYTRPYQAHGSIGPSCAVAQFVDGAMTVWSHTQGVYPDRAAHRRDAAHAARQRPRDPCRGLRLLRPQRRRRCGGRCGADRARASRPSGPRAVDARAGACLGAVRAGDGDEAEGLARRRRQDRRLAIRGVEQHPFDAAGRRGCDAGRAAHGAIDQAAGAEADPVARRRRRPQRDPDLQIPQRARRASLHPRHAGAHLGDAGARRLSQCVLDRELHGRARGARRTPIPSSSG